MLQSEKVYHKKLENKEKLSFVGWTPVDNFTNSLRANLEPSANLKSK
jgi:hypothetical protein